MGELFELLDRAFPGFAKGHAVAKRRGLEWSTASTSFVQREDGRAVAHVGVLDLPLVVDGRERRVAGIHAVGTDPAFRGRGLMRGVMERALAWIDERYETTVLIAGVAALYERFGFRVVPEHRFLGAAPAPAAAASAPPARALDLDDAEDLATFRRLALSRDPVSRVLSAAGELPVALFDTPGAPLRHAADLDAVLWCEVADATLVLRDVFATRMPTLGEIAARIAEPFDRVEIHFASDRLGVDLDLRPERFLPGGDEILMVRGPFLATDAPVALPPSARC